jgi:hypothetical protein
MLRQPRITHPHLRGQRARQVSVAAAADGSEDRVAPVHTQGQ